MLTDAQLTGAGTPFDYVEAIGFGRAPLASFPAGAWGCVAGALGAAVGCFGWIDPQTQQVSNSQIDGAFFGFVLPVAGFYNIWERVFIRPGLPFAQMIIRPGVRCVVAATGDFRAKFPGGGQAGTQVFADPLTGLPYSGNVTGSLIPTRWTLTQSGSPGASILISQMVKPFNN